MEVLSESLTSCQRYLDYAMLTPSSEQIQQALVRCREAFAQWKHDKLNNSQKKIMVQQQLQQVYDSPFL